MKPSCRKSVRAGPAGSGGSLDRLADALMENLGKHLRRRKCCRRKLAKRTVHRSRVQARRLDSQLALLKGIVRAKELGRLRRPLKRLHASLREVRDAEVRIELAGELFDGLPAATQFAAWLRKREKHAERDARGALKGGKGKRLKRRFVRCAREIRRRGTGTTGADVCESLRQAVAMASERAARLDSRVNPDDTRSIHRLRIALKRLLYMIEAVESSVSGIDDATRRQIKASIAKMGRIQDVEMLLAALDEFASKAGRRGLLPGALRERLLCRRAGLIADFLQTRRSKPQLWTPPAPGRNFGS